MSVAILTVLIGLGISAVFAAAVGIAFAYGDSKAIQRQQQHDDEVIAASTPDGFDADGLPY